MREKILAELKKKNPGLSEKILGLVATRLAETVTEETQIENAINGLDSLPIKLKDYADILQRDGDQRVTDAKKKWEQDKTKVEPPENKTDPPPKNDDMPAWAKSLVEKVEGLTSAKQKESIQETINKKLTEKKIPLVFAKGRSVEKLEDLDALIQEVENDWTALQQETNNQFVKDSITKPIGGSSDKKSIDADIIAFSQAGKKENTSQVKT